MEHGVPVVVGVSLRSAWGCTITRAPAVKGGAAIGLPTPQAPLMVGGRVIAPSLADRRGAPATAPERNERESGSSRTSAPRRARTTSVRHGHSITLLLLDQADL